MTGRISVSANRTLHIFNVSDLLYIMVNTEKSNTSDIVLAGDRIISVHTSVTALFTQLSPYMGQSLVKIARDQCINLDNVISVSSEGDLYIEDPKRPGVRLKFFIPSRVKINEIINILKNE